MATVLSEDIVDDVWFRAFPLSIILLDIIITHGGVFFFSFLRNSLFFVSLNSKYSRFGGIH